MIDYEECVRNFLSRDLAKAQLSFKEILTVEIFLAMSIVTLFIIIEKALEVM